MNTERSSELHKKVYTNIPNRVKLITVEDKESRTQAEEEIKQPDPPPERALAVLQEMQREQEKDAEHESNDS